MHFINCLIADSLPSFLVSKGKNKLDSKYDSVHFSSNVKKWKALIFVLLPIRFLEKVDVFSATNIILAQLLAR